MQPQRQENRAQQNQLPPQANVQQLLISTCEQVDDEPASQYLAHLAEIHDSMTQWEAHLRNSDLNGLRSDVSSRLERTCTTWDSAGKNLRENRKKADIKRGRDLQMVVMMMFRSAPEDTDVAEKATEVKPRWRLKRRVGNTHDTLSL